MNIKPIMYLDLDETILLYGEPVHNTVSFFHWVLQHFEVRWLTRWCPSGTMNESQVEYLVKLLKCTPEDILQCNNPKPFRSSKAEAIDWETDRDWVWVENDLNSAFPEDGLGFLAQIGKLPKNWRSGKYGVETRKTQIRHPNYYQTDLCYWDGKGFYGTWRMHLNVDKPNNAIAKTWKKLAKRFNLPGPTG